MQCCKRHNKNSRKSKHLYTDSGPDSITIAATAAAGVLLLVLATNPASFTKGTVDVTNNTITFVEKVNTIAKGAPAGRQKLYCS